MKKILFLVLLCIFAAVVSASAQAGVYLYIPVTTTGVGTGAHLNEVKLLSVQNGAGVSVSQGPNPAPSVPSVSDFVISKQFDKSSVRLQYKLLKGANIAAAEIRYYNSLNAIAYSIKLDRSFLTAVSQSDSGDGCPTGCQTINEVFSFAPQKVAWTNFLTTPNQVLIYDISLNTVTLTE